MLRVLCIAAVSFLCASLSVSWACADDIVINEVMADPASDWDGDTEYNATNDEWVEIYNRGSMAIDLNGYRIGDLEQEWAFGFTGTLAPGEHVVVFGSDAKAWQQANGESAFGLRLSNSGDTVGLWTIVDTDTTLADSYTYLSHEADDDRSSGRRPDGADLFELFDGLNGYTGSTPPLGNGCAPTPGVTNNCVTPVEKVSWGAIKARGGR